MRQLIAKVKNLEGGFYRGVKCDLVARFFTFALCFSGVLDQRRGFRLCLVGGGFGIVENSRRLIQKSITAVIHLHCRYLDLHDDNSSNQVAKN